MFKQGALILSATVALGILPQAVHAAPITIRYIVQDVTVSIQPDKAEVLPGDEVCYTITLANLTPSPVTIGQFAITSNDKQINFFLASDDGEIHPGIIYWPLTSLNAESTRTIKARGRILDSKNGDLIRVSGFLRITSITGSRGGYADVRVISRLPTTGADVRYFRPFPFSDAAASAKSGALASALLTVMTSSR